MAHFGAEDIRQDDGVTHRAAHAQDDIAFVDGQVDHQGRRVGGGAGAVVFGDGVDFLHELDSALGIVKVGEVEADDLQGFVRDVLDRGRWWGRF